MCKLSQLWVYSSPCHLEHFSYSRCTAQLPTAEQALSTVVLADGSLHCGMCIILCLSFAIHKTDSLSANPCSEMGVDAWSLTNCEMFFLFEPYKFPFMLYFNERFLITPRNQEVIKLVLFFHFQFLSSWTVGKERLVKLFKLIQVFATGFYFSNFTSPLLPEVHRSFRYQIIITQARLHFMKLESPQG